MEYDVRHYNWNAIFRDNEKDALWSDDFKKELGAKKSISYLKDIFSRSGTKDILDNLLYADINSCLPEDLLVKMDIATMASSLEARSPFLDHKFMEFSAPIPSSIKLKGMKLKDILKKALKKGLARKDTYKAKEGFCNTYTLLVSQ